MIDYIHKDLYWQDSIDKQLKIELEDGTIKQVKEYKYIYDGKYIPIKEIFE